jgi:cell division protein FtsI (penicillin-binding protein 3)
VTALQMTAAVSAVANGGYLMKPQIVRRIETSTGQVVKETRPVAVRHVLEPGTIGTLTEVLKGVVTGGTGRKAAIPGYVVAGKTGTAQKVDANGRYSMIDHVASFVGFVPASRPELVILVSLDTPRGAANQGGDVAAPLFARIAEQSLRHLAIPPDDPARTLRMVEYHPSPSAVMPAAYHPGTVAAAPAAADPAESGEPGLMPDLRGRSAREAALVAARRGLIVELKGSGRVRAQTPEPGQEIEAGAACVLVLGRDQASAPEGPQ